MTATDIGQLRIYHQQLALAPFTQAGQVVSWLGAMQAQDYIGALWSIGLRMNRATEQGVEQALAERSFVRTWPMRGTLHFVAASDVRWMLALLTPRIIAQSGARHRQLELDQAVFNRSKDIFIQALQGGKHLTRDELYQQLEQVGIITTGQRGYHLLGRAAQDALICFGLPRGKEQTFTLLDEWIAPTKPLTREEALAELARRYFTSHGPATVQDLVRWTGITVTDAKAGIAAVQHELLEESIAGQRYWLPNRLSAISDSAPIAYLLPGFDEYMLGYGDRSAVLDPAYANLICPGGNGVFQPTMVLNGNVVGTWKRMIKKGKVLITFAPFVPLSDVELEWFVPAAERYATFLGLQVEFK
ncbi:MAG: winged helix DNA-binding domain-containing protein [Caldilineaceae bacterium]